MNYPVVSLTNNKYPDFKELLDCACRGVFPDGRRIRVSDSLAIRDSSEVMIYALKQAARTDYGCNHIDIKVVATKDRNFEFIGCHECGIEFEYLSGVLNVTLPEKLIDKLND